MKVIFSIKYRGKKCSHWFLLCDKSLPGKPDIVLKKYGTVIFVNGCFWHRHKKCSRATTPESHREYWEAKFERNVARDRKNYRALAKLGWRVVVIWECRVKAVSENPARLVKALTGTDSRRKIEI